MLISAKQISLRDVSTSFDSFISSNEDSFLTIFKNTFNISEFIPFSFYKSFYSHFGRKKDYSLESFLLAFIIKNILSINSTQLFITFLNFSKELRDYCGFSKIPDKSQFSRFKTTYYNKINTFFHSLVDISEDFAYITNLFLNSILITDTTGFESYVRENNPKFYQSM